MNWIKYDLYTQEMAMDNDFIFPTEESVQGYSKPLWTWDVWLYFMHKQWTGPLEEDRIAIKAT